MYIQKAIEDSRLRPPPSCAIQKCGNTTDRQRLTYRDYKHKRVDGNNSHGCHVPITDVTVTVMRFRRCYVAQTVIGQQVKSPMLQWLMILINNILTKNLMVPQNPGISGFLKSD